MVKPEPLIRRRGEQKPLSWLPLGLPMGATGRRPLAEAIRWMKIVIRDRQNVEADLLDLEGETYNWNEELSKRWMPTNGVYRPEISYKKRNKNDTGK